MNEPIFIQLLIYGESIGLDGTNFKKVVEWGEYCNHIPRPDSDEYKKREGLLRELFFESFKNTSASTEDIWVLKTEYYFRLIEYRELQEARVNALEARKYSSKAITISVLALLASLILGIIQLNSEVHVSNKQINMLLNKFGYSELKASEIEPEGLGALLEKIENGQK